MNRPDVLVLGGGGVLGEAWLRSALAGLEAASGWDLRECDAFVGTSAGSIVAAVLAAGRRPEVAAGVAAAWQEAAEGSAATASAEPGGLRRLAGGTAAALTAPIAPLAAAGLQPGRAALRAAILRRGPTPTRTIPQLGRARCASSARRSTGGCGSRRSSAAPAGASRSGRRARRRPRSRRPCSPRAPCRGSSGR